MVWESNASMAECGFGCGWLWDGWEIPGVRGSAMIDMHYGL